MQENWKEIDLNNKYEISDFGRVRKKLVRRRPYLYMTPDTSKSGYKRITIWNTENGTKKSTRIFVHRLVAIHFLPNPHELPIVNHIDNNPSNNHVSNLEWCTYGQNLAHAYKVGSRSATGSMNNLSKLTEDIVLKIREIHRNQGLFHREIAAMFNVSQPLVTMVINRKIWTHV